MCMQDLKIYCVIVYVEAVKSATSNMTVVVGIHRFWTNGGHPVDCAGSQLPVPLLMTSSFVRIALITNNVDLLLLHHLNKFDCLNRQIKIS
ncbi:hypothetical protein evm_008783 [Chilo suppressalis]|nr:hypothetical protein evm_008783 [Chilo suppressalis]